MHLFDQSTITEVTLNKFQGSSLKRLVGSFSCLLKYTLLKPLAIIQEVYLSEKSMMTGPEMTGRRGTQLSSSLLNSLLSCQECKWSCIAPTRLAHLPAVNLKEKYNGSICLWILKNYCKAIDCWSTAILTSLLSQNYWKNYLKSCRQLPFFFHQYILIRHKSLAVHRDPFYQNWKTQNSH